MGYKTKIDWCDSSWNPRLPAVCMAASIAMHGELQTDLAAVSGLICHLIHRGGRTGDDSEELKKLLMGDFACHSNGGLHILDEPALNVPVYPAPTERD